MLITVPFGSSFSTIRRKTTLLDLECVLFLFFFAILREKENVQRSTFGFIAIVLSLIKSDISKFPTKQNFNKAQLQRAGVSIEELIVSSSFQT